MSPPPLPARISEWTPVARERYRQFVLSKFEAKRSPVKVVIGLTLCFSLVLIPIGLHLLISGLRKRHGWAAQLQAAFIDGAVGVMAYPLMVNSMLRSPGSEPVPGLFIVSFDSGTGGNVAYMADVACRVMMPPADLPGPDRQFLHDLMDDEEYVRARRRRLPASVTGGRAVYAVDLAVHPLYLPGRHLSDDAPMVPCLAEPGEKGEIRCIPYWCVAPVPPPPFASETPVVTA